MELTHTGGAETAQGLPPFRDRFLAASRRGRGLQSVRYFEVSVLENGETDDCVVGVGLVPSNYRADAMPGWDAGGF